MFKGLLMPAWKGLDTSRNVDSVSSHPSTTSRQANCDHVRFHNGNFSIPAFSVLSLLVHLVIRDSLMLVDRLGRIAHNTTSSIRRNVALLLCAPSQPFRVTDSPFLQFRSHIISSNSLAVT